jgi:hypothetical protein
MALVTGTLSNFQLGSIAAFSPTITFTPSGPAVLTPYLLATKPITVVPETDGTFSLDLFENIGHPATWYTIRVEWLNGAGVPTGVDFIDWKLLVPPGGGALGDLIAVPSNPAMVWTSETPPTDPTPGTWWFNPTTGDINEWSN